MTRLNANALRHPRTQWEIEAAIWRAIKYRIAVARTASGDEIVTIIYDRTEIPALMFWRDFKDVSEEFRKVLRAI